MKYENTDVLVVGSGGAGSRAAIAAAEEKVDVILIDQAIGGKSGSTQSALWSIQAPFGSRGMDLRDSPKQFFEDMLNAGRFICDQNMTALIAKTMCDRILDLESYGIKFQKTEEGKYYQTPMPGQTYPRSCFIIRNGFSLATIISNEISRHSNIQRKNDFFAFKCLKDANKVVGVLGLNMKEGRLETILAKSTILSTGGYGALWDHTDNPPTQTGDGLAMAYNAGADIADLEFNHFYGTDVVWPPSVRGVLLVYELLIPEFLSANVYNNKGEAVFSLPLPIRDDAIRIMHKEIQEGRGTPHGGLWLDLSRSTKSKDEVREILESMTSFHYHFVKDASRIDIVEEPIEVRPASHYQCGGIHINERGETTVLGLYACGECSGNSLGANRLAGSALAESQATGAQAGKYAALEAKKAPNPSISREELQKVKEEANLYLKKKEKPVSAHKVKEDITKIVGRYMAPIRDGEGLDTALNEIQRLKTEILPSVMVHDIGNYNMEWEDALKARLMLDTAEITIGSGLFRKESRGHHQRTDYPELDDKNWLVHTIVRLKKGKPFYTTKPVIHINFDTYEVWEKRV